MNVDFAFSLSIVFKSNQFIPISTSWSNSLNMIFTSNGSRSKSIFIAPKRYSRDSDCFNLIGFYNFLGVPR